jgi:cobalt/nickel transport system ATP-binding protein
MNDVLIKITGLSFSYQEDRPVLQGVDLDLKKGERIALTGSNGAGKSTLLHLIVGLLRPASGQIEAFGKPCDRENDFVEVRARAGLLFQDAEDQLFCPTVLEDVAFGPLNLGKTREETKQIVAETLDLLGLGGYEERITYRLSGGEKRLVSLATVLAMRPEVLLLDEPTTALDEQAIQRVIKTLNNLPSTMLIVSQDPDFLAKVSERSIALKGGRFI